MFTGIIEEIGEVLDWQHLTDAARITVRAPQAASDARHGDSISVSGVCLTVVDQGPDWFTADVMAQTMAMSTHRDVQPGTRVNIERAAQVGDRLGGHIVQGHIDGTAELLSIQPSGGTSAAQNDDEQWRVLRFSLDPEHAPLVTDKGSIAVDGISLTVSAVGPAIPGQPSWFEVSLIPETLTATTLGARAVGERVNIETDILARHVARLAQFGAVPAASTTDAAPSVPGVGLVDSGAASTESTEVLL